MLDPSRGEFFEIFTLDAAIGVVRIDTKWTETIDNLISDVQNGAL